ncbi:DUF2795 domain-containing protein [Methanosarcina spelaei]
MISDLQQLPDRTYNNAADVNAADVSQEFSGKRFEK